MDRPTIKTGCGAPAGMGTLLLFVLLSLCGCPVGVDHGQTKPPINVVPSKVAIADVWAITIEETLDRSKHIEQSAIIADMKFWESTLPGRWRHYDKDSDAGKRYLPTIGATPLPALVLAAKQPSGNLKPLKVIAVPSAKTDVTKLISEVAK